MFGVDWDGDGEESLADDVLTMEVIDDMDDHMDGKDPASEFSSGCLGTVICIIIMVVVLAIIFLCCGGYFLI